MADNAETKNIARLDFNIDKAKSSLDEIDLKLKTISDNSEKYAKNIGLAINNGIDYKTIAKSIGLSEKELHKLTTTAQKEAIITKEYRERQEIKTTEALKREHANQAKSVETLYDKISKYANTYLIYQGFNMLKQGISDVIDEMVNMEQQMVAIDRVMNVTGMDINKFRDDLIQLAYDYGNSFDNVADVSLRLAQAGIKEQENLALTEKTLLALNTAELNATQATDDMVAIMSQWGLITEDATKTAREYGSIIDKVNKVADNYPTTSADILDSLKKVSSAFNLAGASIDETIAIIVSAEKASQRGGKAIGTALSNITQQLRDENRLNIAESLGLNFFTDEKKTEFKGIVDIFSEMAQKMQELKDAGKENSVEMQNLLSIFTVFRRNIGASLLGEMSGEDNTYFKVLNDSLTATGYSLQENAKYMTTTKAAQEQFNDSLLQLKTQVWDSGVEDVYKSMLVLGRGLVDNIGLLVDEFGGIPVVVGAATLAFSLLSKQMKVVTYDAKTGIVNTSGFVKTLGDGIKKFTLNITAMPKSIKSTMDASTMSFATLKANLVKYGVEVDSATLKTLGLKAATIGLNLAATAAATAGLMLLTSIIQELINKEANAIQMQENSIEATKKQINTREDEIFNLEELMKLYDELGVKTKRTPEETTQIYEIQTKIKNILGEQANAIDLINGKYEEQKQKLKELSTEEEKRLLDEKQKLMIQKQNEKVKIDLPSFVQTQFGDKNYDKTLFEYGGVDLGSEWEFFGDGGLKNLFNKTSIEEAIDLFTKWEKNLRNVYTESKELENTYNWVNETLNKLTATTKEADEATESYYNSLAKIVFNEVLKQGSKEPSSIQSQFGNIDINRQGITWDDKNIEKYRGQLQELNIDLENLKGSYSNILGASNAFNTQMGEVEIAYSPMLQTDKGLVPLYQDEVNEYIQEVLNKAQDAVNNGEYSNLKDAVLGIDAKGIDDFVDTQGNKIKGLIADVGDTAEETGKQMHENWELISKSFGESIDDGKEFAKLLKSITNLDFDDLKEMGIDTEGINSLSNLQNKLIELAQQNFPDLLNQEKETNEALKEANDTLKTTKAIIKELEIDDLSNKMSKLQSQYTILTTAQNELNTSGEITVGTFKNLVDNNLLSYLDVVNGQVRVNTGSMEALAEQTKISAIESLQAAASEDIHKLALGQEANMSVTAKNAIANFGDSASTAGSKAQTAAGKILELARALAEAAAANKELAGENNVSDFEAKARSISNAYQNIARQIGTIRLSSAGGSSSASSRGSSGSGSGSSSYDYEKEQQKKKEEEKQKKEYEKRLNYFTNTIDRMESKEEEWVKKQKELGLLSNSDMVYVTKRRIKEYEKYLDKIKKADWMNKEDRKKLQDEYNKKLKEAQLDYFDYLKGKLDDEVKAEEEARDKKIKVLEEETDKKIELLKKEREAEKDINERQEILDDIAYWEQRTGREAVENLAEARKRLAEFDRDAQIDAQIEALEENEKNQKASIERQAQTRIDALNKEYQYKVKAFSESDEIIYDNSVISAKNLYNAYKKNFVDPLKEDLKYINKKKIDYTVKKGDTLESIAKEIKKTTGEKVSTIIKRIKKANSSLKNTKDTAKLKKGTSIKIPMYHQGGIFSGTEEGLALLKKGEWVLRPEWSNSMNRMMKYFDNVTQRNMAPISNGPNIEVEGNLVNIQATVRNQSDIDAIGQKVEKILKEKFNIKK